MPKIKKEKLSKRTNRKQNFKKFIASGYEDLKSFMGACKNDENLLIYTCLTREELLPYINKMKEFETPEDQIKYLVNNQPAMNETVKRFDRAVESIAMYLRGYIEFNGFKMANGNGNNEDWTAEFWAKFCKICNFYRTRWFFPETLKKASTVTYSPMLYKEFIYICRMSITGERKHQAFLATQDQNASIFKLSLDSKVESDKNGEKSLADILTTEENGQEAIFEQSNLGLILEKALSFCKKYKDARDYYDQIKDFYDKQDTAGFDKKTIILGKIFLYKAGLISPKTLAFVKALSPTYKARYNISIDRVNAQIKELRQSKGNKSSKKAVRTEDLGWRELILRKRGEL